MSRERELIQQMKESLAESEAPAEALQQGSQTAAPAADAAAAGSIDIAAIFDTLGTVGGSMVGDPLFYLKAGGVLILTVMIIMLAFELIAGS